MNSISGQVERVNKRAKVNYTHKHICMLVKVTSEKEMDNEHGRERERPFEYKFINTKKRTHVQTSENKKVKRFQTIP